ncbi:Zinc finger protein 862, partial [Frankliniella fusca]
KTDSDEWSDGERIGTDQGGLGRKERRDDKGTPTKVKRIGNEVPKSDSKQGPKKFQSSWINEERFKHWLQPVDNNPLKARCKHCNAVFNAGKSELEKHMNTLKHSFGERTKEEILDDKVKKAEIGVAVFMAEHNVALYTSDHVVDMLKARITDSDIVKKMKLDHTKCTAIVKNVLGKTEKEKLVNTLKTEKYSVLVDESTDVAGKKNMVVLTNVPLLKIIELGAADCSAEKMFQKFEEELAKLQVPIINIIGLASDHATVMIGEHNSFASRLKARCPWLVLMDCVCHSSHIAAKNACKKLPSNAVIFVRRVATYVSGSPKRSAIFEEFQEFYNTEQRKLLKVSGTRWLVLHPCVARILENWIPLEQYFQSVVLEDPRKKDQEALSLLQEFRNPFTKAYMFFLKYALRNTSIR